MNPNKIECRECNEVLVNDDLTKMDKFYRRVNSHITKHKLNMTKYRKKHNDESLDQLLNLSKIERRKTDCDPVKVNTKLKQEMSEDEYNSLCECAICGMKAKQLYKHVFNVHSISVDDYRVQYPNSRMESDEYLQYLSESRSGENNPMYNNGSSDLSPFAVEFYIKKGMSKDEAEIARNTFKQGVIDNKDASSYNTTMEYYMRFHDLNKIEARDMQRKRQTTNSIDSIMDRENINRDEATTIRKEITNKWLNTFDAKSDDEKLEIHKRKVSGNSYSKSATLFFDFLVRELNIDCDKYGNNEESVTYIDESGKTRCVSFDFLYNNTVIEYYGDIYHANPLMFKSNENPKHWKTNTSGRTSLLSHEIWERDRKRENNIRSNGYRLLVVWEKDIKENKYRVLEQCREFLLGQRKDGN